MNLIKRILSKNANQKIQFPFKNFKTGKTEHKLLRKKAINYKTQVYALEKRNVIWEKVKRILRNC